MQTREEKRAYHRVYYQTHKAEMQASNKTYRQDHQEDRKASRKAYYEMHKEENRAYKKAYDLPRKEGVKNATLQKKYGISLCDKEAMLVAQNNKCLICQVEFGEYLSNTACNIDHDHGTGNVRALLCARCNLTIGNYEERGGMAWAVKVDAYLLSFQSVVADISKEYL